MIKDPRCYKNPLKPSSIDLILTNRSRSIENSLTLDTGLSDHHKLATSVMISFFQNKHLYVLNIMT